MEYPNLGNRVKVYETDGDSKEPSLNAAIPDVLALEIFPFYY